MIPQGRYTGRVHGIFRPLNLFWRGKVFHGNQVKNRILGGLWVEGRVVEHDHYLFFIHYPYLGLKDTLVRNPYNDAKWIGSMHLGWFVVEFTLEKEGR